MQCSDVDTAATYPVPHVNFMPDSLKNLRMVASSHNPPRIVSVSCGVAELLGYAVDQLLGRSLVILQGPESDAPAIIAALKAAAWLQTSEISLKLYDRSGTGRRYETAFSAELDSDSQFIGCRISLRPDGDKSAGPSTATHNHCSGPPCLLASRRSAHNRYVGLLLQAEADGPAPSPALRLEEEELLGRLLAAA